MKKIASSLSALLIALFLAVLIAEIILRARGEKPGYIWHPPGEHNPDALVVDTFWQVDSFGINRISAAANNIIVKACGNDTAGFPDNPVLAYLVLSHTEVVAATDSNPPMENESFEDHFTHYVPSPFRDMVSDLESGRMPLEDSVDMAYIRFMKRPINDEGFYSIPFKNFETRKRKILVVGDSYTFGFSAIPSYNNFACLLAAKGYAVFNAGMPGAEPAQYAAVLRTYIQKIQPDYVIIGFQSGGDRMICDRPLKPYTGFMYFIINGQFVKAFFNGHYFPDAREAIQFFDGKNRIPANDFLSRLAARTVIGTKAWVKHHQMQGSLTAMEGMGEQPQFWKDSLSFSEKYMLEMDSICRAHGAVPVILLFPECNDMNMTFLKNPPYVFRLISYHLVPGLTKKDLYCINDNHFNNEGHRKVAEYIHFLAGAPAMPPDEINAAGEPAGSRPGRGRNLSCAPHDLNHQHSHLKMVN